MNASKIMARPAAALQADASLVVLRRLTLIPTGYGKTRL